MLISRLMVNFPDWLASELRQRDMSPADLSRASGKAQAVIGRILNGERKAAPETLEAIARALKVSPNLVFEKAGLLPPSNSDDPWVDEQSYRLRNLTGARRRIAENLLKGLEADEIQAAQEEEADNRKLKPAER